VSRDRARAPVPRRCEIQEPRAVPSRVETCGPALTSLHSCSSNCVARNPKVALDRSFAAQPSRPERPTQTKCQSANDWTGMVTRRRLHGCGTAALNAAANVSSLRLGPRNYRPRSGLMKKNSDKSAPARSSGSNETAIQKKDRRRCAARRKVSATLREMDARLERSFALLKSCLRTPRLGSAFGNGRVAGSSGSADGPVLAFESGPSLGR
jgi:hypothetical protein